MSATDVSQPHAIELNQNARELDDLETTLATHPDAALFSGMSAILEQSALQQRRVQILMERARLHEQALRAEADQQATAADLARLDRAESEVAEQLISVQSGITAQAREDADVRAVVAHLSPNAPLQSNDATNIEGLRAAREEAITRHVEHRITIVVPGETAQSTAQLMANALPVNAVMYGVGYRDADLERKRRESEEWNKAELEDSMLKGIDTVASLLLTSRGGRTAEAAFGGAAAAGAVGMAMSAIAEGVGLEPLGLSLLP